MSKSVMAKIVHKKAGKAVKSCRKTEKIYRFKNKNIN
jgi:hypothetical protein